MPATVIITRYDYDAQKAVAPGVAFDPKNNKSDRSLTNQSDMDGSDINKIMARYEKTGVLIDPLGIERKPTYGDFTEITDYHQMLSAIRNAERAFNLLPAKTRNRFNNDPQQLIDFVMDPKNNKEAIELGLIDPPKFVPPTQEQIDAARRKAAPGAAEPPPPAAPAPGQPA